jgi:hypothetical protein
MIHSLDYLERSLRWYSEHNYPMDKDKGEASASFFIEAYTTL